MNKRDEYGMEASREVQVIERIQGETCNELLTGIHVLCCEYTINELPKEQLIHNIIHNIFKSVSGCTDQINADCANRKIQQTAGTIRVHIKSTMKQLQNFHTLGCLRVRILPDNWAAGCWLSYSVAFDENWMCDAAAME